jgi:hypothetical protein
MHTLHKNARAAEGSRHQELDRARRAAGLSGMLGNIAKSAAASMPVARAGLEALRAPKDEPPQMSSDSLATLAVTVRAFVASLDATPIGRSASTRASSSSNARAK